MKYAAYWCKIAIKRKEKLDFNLFKQAIKDTRKKDLLHKRDLYSNHFCKYEIIYIGINVTVIKL